nr:hypothetical protein [Tanacetum cinerariifolium]
VKDKQEKDKIGTKSDKKQEAWKSLTVSKTKYSQESRKREENTSQRGQICNSYKVILNEEKTGTVFEIYSKYKEKALFCHMEKDVRAGTRHEMKVITLRGRFCTYQNN